jgi:hypothetical protein
LIREIERFVVRDRSYELEAFALAAHPLSFPEGNGPDMPISVIEPIHFDVSYEHCLLLDRSAFQLQVESFSFRSRAFRTVLRPPLNPTRKLLVDELLPIDPVLWVTAPYEHR